MAELQKYDRAAAFEMLQKEHGEYATPEQINKELDSYEKANGLGTPVEQTAPVTGSAPPPLSAQDKSIAAQAENYALVPSTARETVNTITAPPVGSTSLPDVASAAWNNLSTAEKYAVGGGTAALGSLVTYGAKKLVDRFLISDKQAVPPIDRTRDISMSDTKPPPPPPPPPEGPKLSAVDQQIMDRQAINRQVREDYLNRTVGGTPTPEVVAQTPEEIRQARQVAAAQAAQQEMAAPPPVNTPKKVWEPPTASLALNAPATPTQIAAPAAASALPPQGAALQPVAPVANVAPEPVPTVPVEPVATPAAPVEPVATTTETPATKATNDQILETLNKVAPKPEVTPETTPAEEKLKWPGKETPGAERWTLGQIGASRENYTKKHAAAIELLKDRTNGILTATHDGGGGLVEQQKLSDLVEHYTGKPIPSKEGGGFARIPKEQVAELHAGILNELQEAAKGGKLKSLGKGALAAAALLGISEAVQAAQKGNFGPLKEAGFDIGIGVLGGPAVMAGQMALTGQTLASGMTPKGQKEFQNRQEILGREGVKDYLQMLKQLNPNPADYTKAAEQYLATNPNAPKTKSQRFNEQTQQQRTAQTQKEHSSRK